ncbi:hypothetical protein C8Q76DRAFT_789441 [Earliella scabrosa]|nr:hypothetical protein C8Q76DRAFT_789441 [Earliella scabrosa]
MNTNPSTQYQPARPSPLGMGADGVDNQAPGVETAAQGGSGGYSHRFSPLVHRPPLTVVLIAIDVDKKNAKMLAQVLKDLKEDQEDRERSNANTIARLDKLNQALDGLNEQGQKMEDTLRAARIRLERALKQAATAKEQAA